MHDAQITNLRESKVINNYKITFDTDAILYQDNKESGYATVSFEIESKNKLRELNLKVIDLFNISVEDKKIGFLYFDKSSVKSFIADYDKINITYKKIVAYEDNPGNKIKP